jgi:Leucine-rich repeat (LRR) protein
MYHKNDLKYKKHRNLTNTQIQEITNQVGTTEDMDTLNYRLKEYIKSPDKSLDLSHLNLTSFPKNIPPTVEHLFMSNNNFQASPPMDLSYLKSLKVFDCCSSDLQHMPTFGPNIVEINCRNNSLKEIPSYTNLKRLDISYNSVSTISPAPALEILVCSGNNLTTIPSYPSLKKLLCDKNKLSAILTYPNLEKLVCTKNNITHIPSLPKLKELICDDNKITKLDNLPNLELLLCRKNNLQTISGFNNLVELDCSENGVTQITALPSIQLIDCSLNGHINLPYFPTLKELKCTSKKTNISKQYKIQKARPTWHNDGAHITCSAAT